uniref:Integrase catalytic domain-containing protein n=1 Tax=Fagus sylvatica TaxID=28930 RepID=A0A2N9HL00_FAGSY
MEEAIRNLCRSLSSFCNHVDSSCDALKQSLDRRPIPLDSASSTFIQCLNRRVSKATTDLNLLDSMTFGTVSFEELLGHCNEVYKKNQTDLSQLQDHLKGYGYFPEVEIDDEDEIHCLSTPYGLESKLADSMDRLDPLYSYDTTTGSIMKSLEADALLDESLSLKKLGLSDVCLASLASEANGQCQTDNVSEHRKNLAFGEVEEKLKSIEAPKPLIKVSNDDYESLPSYMKGLALWEELLDAIEKINSSLGKKEKTKGSNYFHQDEISSLGLGPKARSYLLLLVRLNGAKVQVGAMIGEEGKVSGIEKFDNTDFGYWRMQIEDYLYGKKLHLPLLGEKPEDMEDAEWILLDRQVLEVIRSTLSRSVAHNFVKEKTTAELMTALCSMYEKLSANNKMHLMKKLFNLKMAEGTAVAKHLNEFNTITNQLSSVEIEFDVEIHALIALASLQNSWEARRMATGHIQKNCIESKKKNENDSANVVTEEVHDALLLSVDNPIDSWVLDSRASFHSTAHREIIQNYVVGHAILFVGDTWKITKGAMVVAEERKLAWSHERKRDESSFVKRKVWVYFLKNKSEVFETFKKWRVMVETETDLKLKCLRSDNGEEYIDGGFKEFCTANGIRMEKTIPRTPQQNGVAERMNRTLNERARSMRLHAGLPETFWADAVNTAAYPINRGPSVPLEFRICHTLIVLRSKA